MVFADSEPTALDSMAMGLERSKPLHNFTLPFLKWGNQRYLRCMKLDSDADLPPSADRRSSSSSSSRKFHIDRPPPPPPPPSGKRLRASKYKIHDADEGIAAVREKLMIDLKTAADKMKVAFWRNGVVDEDDDDDDDENEMAKPVKKLPSAATAEPEPEPEPEPSVEKELRPWSLRGRRAASKAPMDTIFEGRNGEKTSKIDKRWIRNSPNRSGDCGGGVKSPGLRLVTEKKEREKFSISLSKKEIEEDFMALTERRPPRRPKKRPRNVQNQIDTLFPGSWLTEITADLYDVPEFQKTGKR